MKKDITSILSIGSLHKTIVPFKHLTFLPAYLTWIIKAIYVKLFLSYSDKSLVVLGNYNNIIAYYLGFKFGKSNKKVVLLDDGLATINIFLNRNMKQELYNENIFGGRVIPYIKLLLGINKDSTIDSVFFYTFFDLSKIHPAKFDNIILANTVGAEHKITDHNLVYFIESPLVENSILERALFDKIMLEIKSYYLKLNKKVIYILHRAEKYELKGFDNLKFDQPLETVFSSLPVAPATVISFYSTALFNLSTQYQNIDFFYYDISKFNSNENIINIYSFFRLHSKLKELRINNLIRN